MTDGTIPLRVFYRHFFARALALIFLPICVYAFFFRIHFAILNKMGPGSPFMSPEFQATLGGNQLVETYPGKQSCCDFCLIFVVQLFGFMQISPTDLESCFVMKVQRADTCTPTFKPIQPVPSNSR